MCKSVFLFSAFFSKFVIKCVCAFSSMVACTLALYSVVGLWMGCVQFFSISTMDVNIILSVWLLCRVGCFSCMLSTYRKLKQSVNMFGVLFVYVVVISLSVLCMAINLDTNSVLKLVKDHIVFFWDFNLKYCTLCKRWFNVVHYAFLANQKIMSIFIFFIYLKRYLF